MELSLSGKRWLTVDASRSIGELIAKRLNTVEDAGDRWCDPTVFPESAKAAERVRRAIKAKEAIAIFGDYDCDGITATAQMLRYFRRHGVEPIVRLPHRVDDGYGLKVRHVEAFKDAGVTLVVTVDTGIAAHAAVATAKEHGIDVLILDHHHVTERPDAFAVLHPALAQDFPGSHPSAAGVVLLFLHALERGHWPDRRTDVALAMFGTVADLVPLSGINRRIVKEGLLALPSLPPGPIADLVRHMSRGNPLTSIDVAFRIAPRINAAGRMADPMIGLRALMEGGDHLNTLESLNVMRQEETLRCVEHALKQINEACHSEEERADARRLEERHMPSFLSVADPSYAPGIVGLIAGKLTETFGRPSMAVTIKGDECTASLRSTASYNIVDGLTRVAHLLSSFGGHAQAAGCSFHIDRYIDLSNALAADVLLRVPPEDLLPTTRIDAILDAEQLSVASIRSLAQLEPFGQGNHEPNFLVQHVTLNNVRCVGSAATHLQATMGDGKLIGFGHGEWSEHTSKPVDIVCRLGIDRWNGTEKVQLMLNDMRVTKEVLMSH